MRRSLVLVDETARHPFLQTLPPHIRRSEGPRAPRPGWHLNRADLREFLLAYCACFMAATAFLA
jgi:hypothetical protein